MLNNENMIFVKLKIQVWVTSLYMWTFLIQFWGNVLNASAVLIFITGLVLSYSGHRSIQENMWLWSWKSLPPRVRHYSHNLDNPRWQPWILPLDGVFVFLNCFWEFQFLWRNIYFWYTGVWIHVHSISIKCNASNLYTNEKTHNIIALGVNSSPLRGG